MQDRPSGSSRLEVYNGRHLREMFASAMSWLEKSVPDINALNVFPVPDGDCGTNMLLTMRSTTEEAYRAPDASASEVAQAMARGALMGARGNSGVILSQIFRGLAQGLEGKKSFAGRDFAEALVQGAVVAKRALSHPVEGTILTVARDAAQAAQEASSKNDDMVEVISAAVQAARASVANTPSLLPVLRDAGVVDAGGQGLYVVLEGVLHYLNGDMEKVHDLKPEIIGSNLPSRNGPKVILEKEEPYGYCTEFLLEGEARLDHEKIEKKLSPLGQCLIVVGDEGMAHIHIHTFEPGKVLQFATSLGKLHDIKIENMDDQFEKFTESARASSPPAKVGTVAVVSGDGLAKVFQSLGISAVVYGGQSMNPSIKELAEAVEALPQDKVIILPNNKNIIPAARQVKNLTRKRVRVMSTRTIPQGVAALLAFSYDAGLVENAAQMRQAFAGTKTIEVTKAVRTAHIGKFHIEPKQSMAFVDGKLVEVGSKPDEVLFQAIDGLDTSNSELLTIYYGENIQRKDAETMVRRIRAANPNLEIELVNGGQPHYQFIASVE